MLWRRRNRMDQTQAGAAFGVSRWMYSHMELGNVETPEVALDPPIQPHEQMLIHRKRLGMTQRQYAKRLGVKRPWVGRMESGDENAETVKRHLEEE